MKINHLLVKAVAVVAIVMLLGTALSQINTLAAERQGRFREAVASVEQSLAGRQAVLGPALITSCTEEWTTEVQEGKVRKTVPEKREFTLISAPRQLSVKASAAMEPRYRGLFKVNTYAAHASLTGQWSSLNALRPQREHTGSKLNCAAPTVLVAVSDARGIRQAQVKVNGDALSVVSGTQHPSYPRGFHADMARAPADLDAPLTVDVMLDLAGTAQLSVAPVADDTQMSLSSDWPHPSFGGSFLPATRQVRDNGFEASWRLSSLATTAVADFLHGVPLCASSGNDSADDDAPYSRAAAAAVAARDGKQPAGCTETFSVAFIDPVNPYSLSDRAIKYGLLFIGLTFLAVGMVEVMRRLRVHPIQYLLVGSAISIFFLLLLSLSEHLSFDVSYAVAASACVLLLSFYGRYLLDGWRQGLAFGAGIGLLYGALYALLQMEQTALVIGSVLLFAVLAGVMVLTRRVDWYGLLQTPAGSAPPAAPQSAA
ncbi:cell envelope integrity protein CreD [Piscinibacter terrae]|uniref:Cell envelope integrity protein CreD n=1 Tax=Piscinibacter terrae TaxID=2496871 RepID=A0A3N7HQ90_9BURK|nr:cell envelope integrity protein CreD [Albitalea terrae]RQP24387.1 cell envelope integrity protein CreD [Albitalea terrae]